MPDEVKVLISKVEALIERIDASQERTYTRNEACEVLGICLKTFKTYYSLYKLPVEDPSNRKATYTVEELRLCAEILRKAGKKIKCKSTFCLNLPRV